MSTLYRIFLSPKGKKSISDRAFDVTHSNVFGAVSAKEKLCTALTYNESPCIGKASVQLLNLFCKPGKSRRHRASNGTLSLCTFKKPVSVIKALKFISLFSS